MLVKFDRLAVVAVLSKLELEGPIVRAVLGRLEFDDVSVEEAEPEGRDVEEDGVLERLAELLLLVEFVKDAVELPPGVVEFDKLAGVEVGAGLLLGKTVTVITPPPGVIVIVDNEPAGGAPELVADELVTLLGELEDRVAEALVLDRLGRVPLTSDVDVPEVDVPLDAGIELGGFEGGGDNESEAMRLELIGKVGVEGGIVASVGMSVK